MKEILLCIICGVNPVKQCRSNPSHTSSFHLILKGAVNVFCVFLLVPWPSWHKCDVLFPQLFPKTTPCGAQELTLKTCVSYFLGFVCSSPMFSFQALLLGTFKTPLSPKDQSLSHDVVYIRNTTLHKLPDLIFFPFMICVSLNLEELYLPLSFLGRAGIEELFLLLFRFWESLKQPEVDKRAFRCGAVPGNFCGLHNPSCVLAELKQLVEVN